MKKYLKLYKNGKFYNAFGDDGIIIHYLLGYKYLEYKNSVGFPVSAYNKVIGRLRKMEIPFLIYDKDLIKYIKCKDINYVIVDRECNIKVIECSNNNYYKYVIRKSVIKILE